MGLVVMAEVDYLPVIKQVNFLRSQSGKGLFLILVGLLIMDNVSKADLVISIYLCIVGSINIAVACLFPLVPVPNQSSRKSKSESEGETIVTYLPR
jgi:hypothetical protein